MKLKLIEKSVLVAEIRKRLLPVIRDKHYDEWEEGQDSERRAILSIIDTLDVKEVDLEKEIDNIWNPRFNLGWDEKSLLEMNHEGFTTIAKYFYELGLKAKGDKL